MNRRRTSGLVSRLGTTVLLLPFLGLFAEHATAAPLPQVTIAVTTTLDSTAADCTANHGCSLRGALNKANAITPYSIVTINVPAAASHYQVRLGSLSLLNNDIRIVGGGTSGTVVDAGGPAPGTPASAVIAPNNRVAAFGTSQQPSTSGTTTAPPSGSALVPATGTPQIGSSGCGCRVFYVDTNAQFRNLTVTGGALTVVQANSSTPAGNAKGAGIWGTYHSQLLIQSVDLVSNQIRAACGPYYFYGYNGGYYVSNGCGSYEGGGLAAEGNLDMIGSRLLSNSVAVDCTMYNFYYSNNPGQMYTSDCYGARGGGAELNDSGFVTGSTVAHNAVQLVCHAPNPTYGSPQCTGARGGGLSNNGTTVINSSLFTCNTAGTLNDYCTHPQPVPPQQFNGCRGQGHQGDGGGLANDYDLKASGLTITYNTALCTGGGALFGYVTSLTSSTVAHNVADSFAYNQGEGGGISTYGNTSMTGVTVDANSAGYWGGGVANTSNLTIGQSEIGGNAAGTRGGGIVNYSRTTQDGTYNYEEGNLVLNGVQVLNNCAGDGGLGTAKRCSTSGSAGQGGGIFSNGNVVHADHSQITGNAATDSGSCSSQGGGITVEPQNSSPNYPTTGATALQLVNGAGISSNSACDGGGIYVHSQSVLIDASSIKNNSAAQDGGGVYLSDANTSSPPAHLVLDHGASVSTNKAVHQTGGVHNASLGDFLLAHGSSISGNVGGSCPQTTLPCS